MAGYSSGGSAGGLSSAGGFSSAGGASSGGLSAGGFSSDGGASSGGLSAGGASDGVSLAGADCMLLIFSSLPLSCSSIFCISSSLAS